MSMSSGDKIADLMGILKTLDLDGGRRVLYFSLPELERKGFGNVSRLPYSLRIVLESLARNLDGNVITEEDVRALATWNAKAPAEREIPFSISRVLMQDFTGVPAVVDLAAMRQYLADKGIAADKIEPVIPTDLVIDHSVQVDAFNVANALSINQEKEIERNMERYQLLKWAQQAFDAFRVFPPSAGICHQVNLEYLATCVTIRKTASGDLAIPDTLVGTDSHTTMIDALGVVGFGVGGIEAEAALLGEPVPLIMPKVLGVKLSGSLREGVTATDFALTMTRLLREKGVVNMFIEFFGEGVGALSLPDRATLSNMCPEYGATVAVFPVDEETLKYMEFTGRKKEQTDLVRKYLTAQGMFNIDYKNVDFSDVMEVDLAGIEPSVSGPSQPKQAFPVSSIGKDFEDTFLLKNKPRESQISVKDSTRWSSEGAAVQDAKAPGSQARRAMNTTKLSYDDGYETTLSDGDVVISSITSCTNTSNPYVMIGAGILAKKALEHGLRVNTRKVKTSLGPGSRVVVDYLDKAGLLKPLRDLGYGLVGYGCITCIGNSGPLIEKQSDAINKNGIDVVAVLSGNRNYAARIHRDVHANYLMSPLLLIAFAIAGTVLKDIVNEPLGKDTQGNDVYLKDIWPSSREIEDAMAKALDSGMFAKEYGKGIWDVNPYWNGISGFDGKLFKWNTKSTYIALPPFFGGEVGSMRSISGARVLAVLGDSISTDHISPAGAIGVDSPAGKYLSSLGVGPADFNTYGSRRGNHEVMMRGTFANNRLVNELANGKEGGFTVHYPDGEVMPIYDAAMRYSAEGIPLVVIAGKEYGSGSSRDWAAKGPLLLGVRAIIAESYERIHKSNLIGMGVLPLQFSRGENAKVLGIDFSKSIDIDIPADMVPGSKLAVRFIEKGTGMRKSAEVESRIDTRMELEYYKAGGILRYVAAKFLKRE